MKINTRHEMFSSVEKCFEVLQENEVILSRKNCLKCNQPAHSIVYNQSGTKKIVYRCKMKIFKRQNQYLIQKWL